MPCFQNPGEKNENDQNMAKYGCVATYNLSWKIESEQLVINLLKWIHLIFYSNLVCYKWASDHEVTW